MNTPTTLDILLTQIAQTYLDIETLETRHSDRLDFHDTAVWRLKDALEAAFNAGVVWARHDELTRKNPS